ncbi:beta-1,3-galactosyl-O-glycosyl-glycoprotein beta-1,6-N-acetylglucosaminyltransferase 4 isoform X1 [Xenopus laevis]|uniref:Beta-1,3-galactosyl-O-glycosyl-glycoprotein beta-1,6-N-acetylglucosaminyltransferase 4 isoform X1 n=3 Tax=Xenopus laevis TaxID=8355 RepID=A0A8J0U9N5_XENLA|nr:beta-1,3-galactosyl-O-glycosyl-glycoprotein beta-1,6-N-acetylglucosaminyltransferase 4 isoform X1 [Xenopus laevis]
MLLQLLKISKDTIQMKRRRILHHFSTLVVCAFFLLGILKLLQSDPDPAYVLDPNLLISQSVRSRSFITKEPHGEINCTAIFELEPVEIGKSLEIRRKHIVDIKDEDVIAMTDDCEAYKYQRQFDLKPLSSEEKDFSIAYSLVVHKDAISVERLLHTIYSPANIYCIHYDQKSMPAFKKAMANLAKCLPNVFIASKLENVIYAHITRLQADLNCLSDLLKSPVQWKYVINLCGQDMPLKSNYELVAELKKLNGHNMLETSRPSDIKKKRHTFHHEVQNVEFYYKQMPVRTSVTKEPPPGNLEIFIGSAYFVLSHSFVSYIFGSPLVKEFLAWSEDTYSPDEHFWATLVRMPGVPGEIPRSQKHMTDLDSKTRLVKWSYLEGSLYPPCTGMHVRSVCIYGAGELRWLMNYGHWFANKFDPKVDPTLIKCLIEKLEEKQRDWVNMS